MKVIGTFYLPAAARHPVNSPLDFPLAVYHPKHGDDVESSDDDMADGSAAPKQFFKFKASGSHKGPYDFDNIKPVQQLGSEHHVRLSLPSPSFPSSA